MAAPEPAIGDRLTAPGGKTPYEIVGFFEDRWITKKVLNTGLSTIPEMYPPSVFFSYVRTPKVAQ